MQTILVLLISAVLTGCAGFVYNSPNHPDPVLLMRVEQMPKVIGFMCDKKTANCKPAYTHPTYGYGLSLTPHQDGQEAVGFWCDEKVANCKPVYASPTVTQTTTTTGFGIIQQTPLCARNGCLPYSFGSRYGY